MKIEDVKKFSLIIIESLPDCDKKTGYNLFSSIIKYKQFQKTSLSSKYYDVTDKNEFLKLIKNIINQAIENNHFYIFHFEIHGFENGINLKSGEDVHWKELIPFFRKLNFHYRNTLAICLAVCKGANLLRYINPSERAPFKILISSASNIHENDIIHGFEEFYNHYFFSFDPYISLEKYNSVISKPEDRLEIITSEYCFDNLADIERETADKQALINSYKNTLIIDYPDMQYFPEEYLNKYIEKKLTDLFDKLKLNRNYFLMNDLKE